MTAGRDVAQQACERARPRSAVGSERLAVSRHPPSE